MSQDIVRALARACRVEDGESFHLSDHPPDRTAKGLDKDSAQELLVAGVQRLSELQDRLYAQDRHAVLAIFQAMDAGGKDGVIKHVFSGVNPQGCHVTSFKAPGPEELDHDFLWRHQRALPARGQIGIHNRSWYEEVLVARVHPAVLARQGLPPEVITPAIWDERLEDIAAFERYLTRQGFVVLKFFLNLSKEEQAKRFLARIDTPAKNWKLADSDIEERQHWDAYRAAYDTAIRATARPAAPWYVVPADRKWLTRLLVVDTMVQALEALDPQYPSLDAAERERLERARKRLQAE
jgi:PPK2 family polyphosphate:nucleotide phosphotransferase